MNRFQVVIVHLCRWSNGESFKVIHNIKMMRLRGQQRPRGIICVLCCEAGMERCEDDVTFGGLISYSIVWRRRFNSKSRSAKPISYYSTHLAPDPCIFPSLSHGSLHYSNKTPVSRVIEILTLRTTTRAPVPANRPYPKRTANPRSPHCQIQPI